VAVPNEAFQIVNQSDGPPPSAWTKTFAYDGSGNTEYQAWARSNQDWYEWTKDSGNLVSITVTANVATATFLNPHGLEVGHAIETLNTGTAGANVVTKVSTVPLTTTITFPLVIANGTYSNGGAILRTQAPRKNAPMWIIQKFFYNGSSQMIDMKWAQGNTRTMELIWDDRATYDYR
jgi:hypothetical protein